MKQIVVFRECHLSTTEFAERVDHYLAKANETFGTLDAKLNYEWNERRDRLTIRSSLLTVEITHLAMKGVLVIARLSMVAIPFRHQIEHRIDHALKTIFESKGET